MVLSAGGQGEGPLETGHRSAVGSRYLRISSNMKPLDQPYRRPTAREELPNSPFAASSSFGKASFPAYLTRSPAHVSPSARTSHKLEPHGQAELDLVVDLSYQISRIAASPLPKWPLIAKASEHTCSPFGWIVPPDQAVDGR